MAKFEGIFEIQGTVKGMSFYKTKDGLMVRSKGGISKKRIANDPAFQRTRENNSEFGHNAKMGQLMRKSVAGMMSLAKDNRVSSRLAQTMSLVKNLDLDSPRGERKVWVGIAGVKGKQALKGFDFNGNSPFHSVFRGQYALNTSTGIVSIDGFNPGSHLRIPQGATHASFSSAIALIDFEMDQYETIQSEKSNFALTDGLMDVSILVDSIPAGTGVKFFYFLIEFYQELNGVQYPSKNNSHNVLHILDVV